MKKQRKIKYTFNEQGFSSLEEFKKYVSNYLKPLRERALYPEDAKFSVLIDLFTRHPEAELKRLSEIRLIFPMKSFLNNSTHIVLFYRDNTKDDISWNMCITGKDKSEHYWDTQRYRRVVQEQIEVFKNNSKGGCVNCYIHKNLEVDHATPTFRDLIKEFKKLNLTLNDFPNFHRQKANLQILCRDCNQEKFLQEKQLLKEQPNAVEQLSSAQRTDTFNEKPYASGGSSTVH